DADGRKVTDMAATDEVGGNFLIERLYGDTYHYGEGSRYAWGAEATFNFGNDYEELHEGLDYVGKAGATPAAQRYVLQQYTGSFVGDPEKEIFEMPVLGKERE